MADASQEELRTLTWRSEKTMRMADELKIAQQRVHELEDQVDDLSSTLNSLLGRPKSPAASRASHSQTVLKTLLSSPPRKGASLSASSSSALCHMTVALGAADEKLSLEELMTGKVRHSKSEDKTSIDIAALVAATDEQGHAVRHPEGLQGAATLTQVAGVTKQEPIASSAAALRRREHAEQEAEDGVELAVEQEVSAERLAKAVAAEYIRAGSARFGFARVAGVVEPESVQALEARVSDLRQRVALQTSPRESLKQVSLCVAEAMSDVTKAGLSAQQTSDRPKAEGVVGHGAAGGQGQTEVEERETDVGASGCRGLQGLDDDSLRLQSSFGQRLQAAFNIGLHQLPPSATTSSDEHVDSVLPVLDQDIQRLEHENLKVDTVIEDEELSGQEELEGVTGDTGEDEDEDSLALLLRYSQGGCDPWELGADEDSDKCLEGEWGPCHELATVDEESIPETESLERGDDKKIVLDESIHGENEHMLMAQFEVEHARGSVSAHPLTLCSFSPNSR